MAVTREHLSAGTLGASQLIANQSSPGTLVHTVPASVKDEVYLYAYNFHSADLEITIELGSNSAAKDRIAVTIPFDEGLFLVVPGNTLGAAQTVHVFCVDQANVISIWGHVNRDDT